jgi:hypothetical protein
MNGGAGTLSTDTELRLHDAYTYIKMPQTNSFWQRRRKGTFPDFRVQKLQTERLKRGKTLEGD